MIPPTGTNSFSATSPTPTDRSPPDRSPPDRAAEKKAEIRAVHRELNDIRDARTWINIGSAIEGLGQGLIAPPVLAFASLVGAVTQTAQAGFDLASGVSEAARGDALAALQYVGGAVVRGCLAAGSAALSAALVVTYPLGAAGCTILATRQAAQKHHLERRLIGLTPLAVREERARNRLAQLEAPEAELPAASAAPASGTPASAAQT